jgi:DNA recombination-dependent growth factor C
MCDDTTPRQRDFQHEATNIESDGGPEPYETPVVLQKKKKKVVPAPVIESSEAEDSEVERNNRRGVERKNKGKSPVTDSITHEVSSRDSVR